MQRRFAILLLAVLVLLLVALLAGRHLTSRAAGRLKAVPTARPTSVVPPTPIPARGIAVWFENPEDEKLHPEARDVPVASDDVAFLRLVAGAVLEGPRRPELLRPFPDGWTLRAAYRLKDGLAILDLAPPLLPADAPPPAGGALRWETGTHAEETAVQALAVTVVKNIPGITRLVLLVGGEPAETLAGHVDLGHPLHADFTRAVDEPPLPPPPPTPTSPPAPTATTVPPSRPSTAPPPARPTRPARPLAEAA